MVDGNQANVATGPYSSHFTEADVIVDYSENSALDCSNPAGALQTTASFGVSASVDANCLIQADDIDFGSVGMITKDIAATGALHVTCTPGASYAIAMGNGLYYDGSTRRMRSASGDVVSYGLYQQDGGLQPWGNNRGVDTADGTATGSDDKTIYGIVPPQPAVPGSYDDQVVVTIFYN
jgi:spore coat protein U-like protein